MHDAPFGGFPPRDSQGTITPFPGQDLSQSTASSSPLREEKVLPRIPGPGAGRAAEAQPSPVGVDKADESVEHGHLPPTSAAAGAYDSEGGMFGLPPATPLSAGSDPFSFAPPPFRHVAGSSSSSSSSSSNNQAPSHLTAGEGGDSSSGRRPEPTFSQHYLTRNASVDSLQQLQPCKQQRVNSPNLPSTSAGGVPPPRSSSLMAAFNSAEVDQVNGDHPAGIPSYFSPEHEMNGNSHGYGGTSPSQLGLNGRPGSLAHSLISPSTSSLAPSVLPGQASGMSAFTAADTSSTRSSLISFGSGATFGFHAGSQAPSSLSGAGDTTIQGPSSSPTQGNGAGASSFQFDGQGLGGGKGRPSGPVHHHQPPPAHVAPVATKRKMPS